MATDPDETSAFPTADEVDHALRSFWQGSFTEFGRLVDEGEDGESEVCSLLADVIGLSPGGMAVPSRIGDYEIVRQIGRGGMAVVYEATQERPKRTVALKVIRRWAGPADRQERLFRREVDTLARLKHPHIATLYDAGQTPEGQHYFAMELVGGLTLAAYLSSVGAGADLTPKDRRSRLALFSKICRAMNYAHQRGVIHRDLKPSNIFVNAEGEPKILDFGLARLLDTDMSVVSSIMDAGTIVGTLNYMSPEQAQGRQDEIDIRSDVYSLGIILYEMLTGRRPYRVRGVPLPEAIHNICEAPPRRPSTLTPAVRGDLETVILKALEKEPDRRYASAAALADDVEHYLSNQPILARSPSAVYQLQKMVSRHKLPAALAAALFLLTTTFAIVFGVQTARIAEERDNARAEAQRAEQFSNYLGSIFPSIDPDNSTVDIPVREVLDRAAAGIAVELKDLPETQAALRTTIGRSYLAIGALDQAELHLRAAHELCRALYGEQHPAFAASLHELGILAGHLRTYDQAEANFMRALALRRELLGEKHVDVAESLHELGLFYKGTGDWTKSEHFLREALAMRRELLGQHRAVADTLYRLSTLLIESGRYDDAEPLLNEAVEMCERVLGPNHYNVGLMLGGLGDIHYYRGELDKAERVYRRQYEILQRVFVRPNRLKANTVSDLAIVCEGKGDFVEAERLHRASVEMQREAVGSQHLHYALNVNNLAMFLKEQGRYREAEPLCRDVYALWYTRNKRKPAAAGARAARNMASVLVELERLGEAEPLYRDAVAIWRRLSSTSNPPLAKALTSLGRLRYLRGDGVEAESLCREGVDIYRDCLGGDNPKTARGMIRLADVLAGRETGEAESLYRHALAAFRGAAGNLEADEARVLSRWGLLKLVADDHAAGEALFREAIEIERGLPREKHPVLAVSLRGLAEVLLARGAAEEAEPLLLEALDIQQERLVEGDRRTALTQSALGACLAALGRHNEAEPILLESHAIIERFFGPEHQSSRAARQRLVDLYTSWERPDQADEWRAPPVSLPSDPAADS